LQAESGAHAADDSGSISRLRDAWAALRLHSLRPSRLDSLPRDFARQNVISPASISLTGSICRAQENNFANPVNSALFSQERGLISGSACR